MGYFFTFYDIADIGFAMPAIATQFNLTGNESLFVALSVGLIGYIVGSYLVGTLSDRSGRYKAMLATMIITAIGSFGDADFDRSRHAFDMEVCHGCWSRR